MRAALRSLRAVIVELFLGVIGQPRTGLGAVERARHLQKTRRVRQGKRAGPVTALRTLVREAVYGLIGQPSPGERSRAHSDSSRRKPRS